MKKQLQQTNGHINGTKQHKSKLSIPEIEAFITEAQEVLASRKKKKNKKKAKNKQEIQQSNPTLLQKFQDFRLQKMSKNHHQEKTKRKFLEKEVILRDNKLSDKDKEIKELQHVISTQEKAISKTFDTSQLLQLVKPVLRSSNNPFTYLKNYLRFRTEIREYNKQVSLVGKAKV